MLVLVKYVTSLKKIKAERSLKDLNIYVEFLIVFKFSFGFVYIKYICTITNEIPYRLIATLYGNVTSAELTFEAHERSFCVEYCLAGETFDFFLRK